MSKTSHVLKHLDFTLIDLLCLIVSFLMSYLFKLKDGISVFNRLYFLIFIWIIVSFTMYFIIFNPYKNILRRNGFAELQSSIMTASANALSVAAILYAFKSGAQYSRTQLAYTYLLFTLLSTTARTVWKKHIIATKRDNKINVLIACDSREIDQVITNIENSEFNEYRISGLYLFDNHKTNKVKGYTVFDNKLDIEKIAVDNNVLEVFAYCKPELIDKKTIKRINEEGIQFHLCIDRIFDYESEIEENSNIAMYKTLKFSSFSFEPKQILYLPLKRFLDILFSAFACLFLIPIYIFVKINYLLEGDREPIIYKHTRVGKDGKEFDLYKFRSMVYNADEVLKEVLKDDKLRKEWEENHKLNDDPRITRIGRFIRKTSIDEFPQFINVLKGDMTIIGPRPLVPGELKGKNGLNLYERVKPGITGWWACNGRSNITYEERLELEYYYVKNFSLGLDIMCVLKTIYVVLFQKGAK